MSEKLQNLYLVPSYYASVVLGEGKQWRRDIQDIFTPSKSKIAKFFARDAFGMLNITAKAAGDRPAYSVCTYRDFNGQTHFANKVSVAQPGQAAAWAALRMYLEHPHHGDHPEHVLQELSAVDPNKASAPRFADLKHFREEETLVFGGKFWAPAADVLYVEKLGSTIVTAENKGNKTLPELLGNIKNLYDELYPADQFPAVDTSAAIAGLVGAREVEAFGAIWQELREGQPDPVLAARQLLHSGVFTAADQSY